jgi:hypothetical protein
MPGPGTDLATLPAAYPVAPLPPANAPQLIELASPEATARRLTDHLRRALVDVWADLAALYQMQAWTLLGYPDWDAYVVAEFDTAHWRLPRAERPAVVTMLRAAGLTVREIAAATGSSKSAIGRDISPAVPNGTEPDGGTGDQDAALDGQDDPAVDPATDKPPTPASQVKNSASPRRPAGHVVMKDLSAEWDKLADRMLSFATDDTRWKPELLTFIPAESLAKLERAIGVMWAAGPGRE